MFNTFNVFKPRKLIAEDIILFRQYFDNLPTIISKLNREKIGFQNGDNKKLAGTVFSNNPNELIKDRTPVTMLSKRNNTPHNVIKPRGRPEDHAIFNENKTAIPGINQHLDNPNLFLSVAPDFIEPEKAAEQVRQFVNRIADMHIHPEIKRLVTNPVTNKQEYEKTLTFLVIGNKAKKENFGAYIAHITSDLPFSNDSNFSKHGVDKNAFGTEAPFEIYYMDARDNKFHLTSRGIDALHYIYESTIKSDQPLLIHCEQGVQYTPIIALAFELYRKFVDWFIDNNDNIDHVRDECYNIVDLLDRSHSDSVLDAEGIQQAIYLVFALKMVGLLKMAMQNLEAFMKSKETDLNFAPTHKKLTSLIKELHNSERGYQAKFDYFFKEMILQDDFHIRGSELFELLMTLKVALANRYEIDNIVLPICSYDIREARQENLSH